MLQVKENYFILGGNDALPMPKCTTLYLDIESINVSGTVETTDPTVQRLAKKHGGMYPFKGDRIAGVSVTWDDCVAGYYVPLRHTGYDNVPLQKAKEWLQYLVSTAKEWVNHNIVFDACFLHFEGVEFECRLLDTLTLSKLIDSDRMQYGLKQLTADWLGYSNDSADRVQQWLKDAKSSNWGDVPADLLGEYAIDDVMRNRELYHYLLDNKIEDLDRVWENEILLTPILYDMEVEGLLIDKSACKLEGLKALRHVIQASTTLTDILDGEEYVDSEKCLHSLLMDRFGLPILERSPNTGAPCFDKNVLAAYMELPQVVHNPEALRALKAIITYRQELQFYSLYANAFLALADDKGYMHPRYNAIVRTGRMSASRPNIQQQTKRSKNLICAPPGFTFISKDYSQIEFRLIIHYINDQEAIDAYAKDPNTDFHQWVADLIHTKRRAGKHINFSMAFGAQRKKVTEGLATNSDIIEEMRALHGDMDAKDFLEKCAERASDVYTLYHERLPGIKATTQKASDICKFRGYVFNIIGRRRQLPAKAARNAFNSIIQGSAMDIMKEGLIALSPRYNAKSKELGLRIIINVHDEVVFLAPSEKAYCPELHKHIDDILENPQMELRVPMKVDTGVGTIWANCV